MTLHIRVHASMCVRNLKRMRSLVFLYVSKPCVLHCPLFMFMWFSVDADRHTRHSVAIDAKRYSEVKVRSEM